MSKKSLVYTASALLASAYIEKNHQQRNPAYFEAAEKDVEAVVVIGDFPDIVEAYKAVDDCSVKAIKEPASGGKAKADKKPTKAEIAAEEKARLEEERVAQRNEIDAMDEPELKDRLVGLETDKDGEPHKITVEDLADLDLETLRSMVIEAVFIDV